jgi:predicted GIY-YIG superfamily endonuclease
MNADAAAIVVYCLVSASGRRTYVGYTIHLARRLRQHRGELVGGAAATHGAQHDWRLLYVVRGLPSRRAAMQLEWRLHRLGKHGRRRHSVAPPHQGRLDQLREALAMERWTSTAPRVADLVPLLHVDYAPSV